MDYSSTLCRTRISNSTHHAAIDSPRFPSLGIDNMCLAAFVNKSRNRLGSSTTVLGDHVCPLHPGLLTASETVHDENQTAYLPLLRHLNSASNEKMTSEQTLETAIHLINTHQLLPELSTFHLALALHTTVPRIEAAYSWYSSNVDLAKLGVEDCASWVEWSGKGYCDVESLRQDLDSTIGYTSDS
jgi:hypothetical protein